MKWKNPDELRRLGFWPRNNSGEDDFELEYELCLADDQSSILFEIRLAFTKPCAVNRLKYPADEDGHLYSGSELTIFKLHRERLGGPLLRGMFIASRPLFFTSFRDVEVFVAAFTGVTPLFPLDREPQARDAATSEAEDLYRNALSLLSRD
jgi:hypothetical protein